MGLRGLRRLVFNLAFENDFTDPKEEERFLLNILNGACVECKKCPLYMTDDGCKLADEKEKDDE